MGFTKKKEANIHLPFPCLITGVLQSQGLKLYLNEPLCQVTHKHAMDSRLFQGTHFDDMSTLSSMPTPGSAALASTASGSSSARPHSASDPAASPELMALHQQAEFLISLISGLKINVVSLQTSISNAEDRVVCTQRQIATLEEAARTAPTAEDDVDNTSSAHSSDD
ncbi:PREDICTED: uncharacterized protein LOC109152054 [Ipomoea nil]|uniref:uncharacterized protein LOC109152054 n=1 Tax=Ipomoea nil TaxID=35883 RepID=UPI000901174B|nr:PREDICTED: uncharacterized protein LOC109152054 [Ipomoea nil]